MSQRVFHKLYVLGTINDYGGAVMMIFHEVEKRERTKGGKNNKTCRARRIK